eukprot:Lithocolla_globosa_v1_NODE_1_length_16663_cov_42.954359.p6 type:complete len:264 gc:universal NODE_1_length_16663_cov_42.954359:8425-9216(+)
MYEKIGIPLSVGQFNTIKKAIRDGEEINIKVADGVEKTEYHLMLTNTQIKKINKAFKQNKGTVMKFSETQLKANKAHWPCLMSPTSNLNVFKSDGVVSGDGVQMKTEPLIKVQTKPQKKKSDSKTLQTIDNFTLEKMMKDTKHFKGVYPKDLLVKEPLVMGKYIINLDDSTNKGTHWVGLIVLAKVALYFDSFGLTPPTIVKQWLKEKKVIYSTSHLQNLDSTACGYYVMDFLKSVNNKNQFYKFIYRFEQSGVKSNDKLIQV